MRCLSLAINLAALMFVLPILVGCGKTKHRPPAPGPVDQAQALEELYFVRLAEIQALQSSDGWIETETCDAALWTGKLGASYGVTIDYRAAEYPGSPGRFNRRPEPFCEEGAGSASSWSRDMGLGLFAYAYKTKDLGILEDHAAYGNAHSWKMGEPLADGRVLYSPAMIGTLYQIIYALGGEDNAAREWPSLYASNMVDFSAHLQMMDIWLRGEVAEKAQLRLIDVTDTMLERIKEHAEREQQCPFYQYMAGVYNGDLNKVTELLLSQSYDCEYFREHEPVAKLGEWIFAASVTLERLGAWD